MDEVKPRRFQVRTHADLTTDEQVAEVRERLAARSGAYRAMTEDPFSIIRPRRGTEDDIPF